MTTSRQVTAAMRGLAPAPVFLATRAAGAGWHVFMPRASAQYMAAGTPAGDAWLGRYLTRRLGEPVHVAAVKFSRAAAYCGRTAMLTVLPGQPAQAG